VRLSLGVTGHRGANPHYGAHRDEVAEALAEVFDSLDATVADETLVPGLVALAPTRLHSMLVDGFDQLAAEMALTRGWDLVAPLPFGQALNTAVNAGPESIEEAKSLLTGEGPCGASTRARADAISTLQSRARLFELADLDERLGPLYLAALASPTNLAAAQAYSAPASAQVALAARVMIEQSDLIIAVWDGASASQIGGAGQTIALALELGAPVVWIDARAPQDWRILRAPEALASIMAGAPSDPERHQALSQLVREALQPTPGKKSAGHGHSERSAPARHAEGLVALNAEVWRPHSAPIWHGYRRVEALFGAPDFAGKFRNLTQTYEPPDAIATGSGAAQLTDAAALPGQERAFVDRLAAEVLRRFAWADGISARLSDTYRGGMMLSFIFSALAIVGGLAYIPFASHDDKWAFAVVELLLLLGIVGITFVGRRLNWHRRWFETRRVAEYFRHAPILLLLGVARPIGRWPRGSETSWPEWYARHALRDVGLPKVKLTSGYLREALERLLLTHVVTQRDYHRAKAARLARAHHQLDQLSGALFSLAVLSVATYLALNTAAAGGFIDEAVPQSLANLFTFLGVALPTFGGAIAGIRYFGDFERFSAISEVTSQKLDAVAARIVLLLAAPPESLTYAQVSELAHAADDIVVDEIENWQAVFGGKHVTVPV
jgi:hypothetical protein